MGTNRLIIGISGKKQSGKNTAAEQIIDLHDSQSAGVGMMIGFADYLKHHCIKCGFMTPSQAYGSDEQKNTASTVSAISGAKVSARDALQQIGRIHRAWGADCFINAWRYEIGNSCSPLIITPDVRYPNEVEAVHNMGGKVIRLLRAPHDDQHESETALDDWPDDGWDALINNSAMSIERQGEVIRETVTPWLEEAGLIGDKA